MPGPVIDHPAIGGIQVDPTCPERLTKDGHIGLDKELPVYYDGVLFYPLGCFEGNKMVAT